MLHQALKLLRTYHQLSQVDLAKRIGISSSYLSEIENKIKSPSLELLEQYANLFKMPLSSILLFSESVNRQHKPGAKLQVAAAKKIIRLLEWAEERLEVVYE